MLALIALLAQFALFNCGPIAKDGSFQCNAVQTPTATMIPTIAPTATASPTPVIAPEVRATNAIPNRRALTVTEIASVRGSSVGNGLSNPNYVVRLDGQFVGTTDQIIYNYWQKWFGDLGFDPDIGRAVAVQESNWYQWKVATLTTPDPITGLLTLTPSHGDLNDVTAAFPHGGSWGLYQIKQNDFTWSYPLSAESTPFNADFKLMYQRACFDGQIAYLGDTTNAKGNKAYLTDTGLTKLWGCVGNWYSGWYYDSAAKTYISQTQATYAAKSWLKAGF